jgi:hypothetical protein
MNESCDRIIDVNKGGHWSISPTWDFRTKQQYLPQSNVLGTKFLNDKGIGMVTGMQIHHFSSLVIKSTDDFIFCPIDYMPTREACMNAGLSAHLTWMIRKVHVIRGTVPFRME